MSRNSITGRILENAQRLVALNDAITHTYKNKKNDPEAWREACSIFNSSYNQLAFQGGLAEGMAALKKKDLHTIEVAIEYLKADPFYHRSGYNKKQIVHLLKHAPLTQKQRSTLQEILVTALKSKHILYMEYCRLARAIQDPSFKAQLEELADQSDDIRVVRRAKKMLQSMRS